MPRLTRTSSSPSPRPGARTTGRRAFACAPTPTRTRRRSGASTARSPTTLASPRRSPARPTPRSRRRTAAWSGESLLDLNWPLAAAHFAARRLFGAAHLGAGLGKLALEMRDLFAQPHLDVALPRALLV